MLMYAFDICVYCLFFLPFSSFSAVYQQEGHMGDMSLLGVWVSVNYLDIILIVTDTI